MMEMIEKVNSFKEKICSSRKDELVNKIDQATLDLTKLAGGMPDGADFRDILPSQPSKRKSQSMSAFSKKVATHFTGDAHNAMVISIRTAEDVSLQTNSELMAFSGLLRTLREFPAMRV